MMRRLWYAQTISVFGDFLALFAVISILTFKLHATAQQVTGVQIAYMLPIAILGILAGVFVDRWPLKPTMVSSDSIRAALCLSAPLRHADLALLRRPRRHQRRLQLLLPRPGSRRPLRRPPAWPALRQRALTAGHVRNAHHRPRHRRVHGRLSSGRQLLCPRLRELRRLRPAHRITSFFSSPRSRAHPVPRSQVATPQPSARSGST